LASYRCTTCGYQSVKWMGFCPQCRSEEPLVEYQPVTARGPAPEPVPLSKVGDTAAARRLTGIAEFDRVLGGGVVAGSVILVGGEPGIGKSTLLLQAAGSLAGAGGRTLLVTAEESAQQVGLRASRLGVDADDVLLLAEDDLEQVIAAAAAHRPDLLIVDSIQTVAATGVDGAPGGPAQVRESAARLVRFAKSAEVATVLVGHVTKDGAIAGPKLVEHMVDVVLYFEGDPDYGLRALRSVKNRFGATQVVGMFEMQGEGLVEVADPSRLFLSGWRSDVPGTVVFPAVEGRRAVMVEVQALVTDTTLPQPRRSVRGVDPNRLHQIVAILSRRAGMNVTSLDIYVNVVGGWHLSEPAADLPVALAIASSLQGTPLGSVAAWGEMGLAGEVRAVPFDARRREEAGRVGIETVVAPAAGERSDIRRALLRAGLG
jgi:DNA repair protein RadA/Sms